MTGGNRPTAWEVLPLIAPDGVLKVRVGVVVDLVCTCKARPVLVRVLDTEHGRMVVSRRHHPPNAKLRAAKAAGLWDGGSQQHVQDPTVDAPQPGDPVLTKVRNVARARLGYVGWEDFPFWYDPWPWPLFAYGPRCRCQTADTWWGEPAFKRLIREALASGKRTVGINSPARRD